MPAITSTGLGSGLKINDIVEGLVAAEKDPQINKITSSGKKAADQISALGVLNSALADVKSSYSSLSVQSNYNAANASSSDPSIITATTGIGATAGSYNVSVEQLAQNHTITTSAYNTVNDSVGEGTLTLRFGDYSSGTFAVNADKTIQTITVDSSNNTVSTLRDSINAGDYGVTASIVNDGTGYRLVIKSNDSGQKNNLEIVAADSDGNNTDAAGLSKISFDENNAVFGGTNTNMTQTLQGKDAKIVMDGITITRDSNSISEVVQGVTFDLVNASPGKNISVSVSQDSSQIQDNIRKFVDTYNKVMTNISEVTRFNSANGEKGILIGDATIRGIQSSMRGILNTQLKEIGGSVQSIADLGILTTRDGSLEIDETKFNKVLSENISDVARFFASSGTTTDPQVLFISNNTLTKAGTYNVEVSQLATKGELKGAAVLPDFSTGGTLLVDSSNDTFKIRVDGILSEDITLANKTYTTEADLISEIQTKINSDSSLKSAGVSLTMSISANQLVFTSTQFGSQSIIGLVSADAGMSATLGIDTTSMVATSGVNVAGKIDGVDALGDGQYLLSETGDSSGLKIQISGGALGSRGTVNYSEGVTSMMNVLLDGIIDKGISSGSGDVDESSGIIDSKTDSLYKKIQELDRQKIDIERRMDKYQARLFKQFNAMDSIVNQLNGTSNALQGALDALPGYTRNKK